MDKNDLFKAIFGDDDDGHDPENRMPKEDQIELLKEFCFDYRTPPTFKIGDLVEQRPDYSFYKYPALGSPAIVLDIFDEPAPKKYHTKEPFFKENLIIAVVVGDEKVVSFMVEAHRFKHYSEGG